VLYVCWSAGYNFRSGSEDAWLYDTLTDGRSEDAFANVRGRGVHRTGNRRRGAITGGYLGSIDLSYPWFVASAMTAVGVLVLLTVDESETYERTDTDDLSLRRTILIVRQTLSQRNIRAFVLYYYVLYAAVTYLVFVFLQPIFETVVLDLGVSQSRVKSLLGWFYATYSLFGAGLSYYTGAIRARLGLRTWFLWLPFIVGGALIGMYFVPVLALPTFLLIRGLSDVTRSFAGQYINDRIGTMGRATVLSAMAMVSGLAVVPFQLGSGILSDVASPLFALAVAGGVLVVATGGAALGGTDRAVTIGTPQSERAHTRNSCMSPHDAHGCEQVSVFQIRPSKSSIRCGKTRDSTIGRGQFAKQCRSISSPIHGLKSSLQTLSRSLPSTIVITR